MRIVAAVESRWIVELHMSCDCRQQHRHEQGDKEHVDDVSRSLESKELVESGTERQPVPEVALTQEVRTEQQ